MIVLELPGQQFRSLVRMLKTRDLDVVGAVFGLTEVALDRLGVERDPAKAAVGVPDGYENTNVGVVKEWLEKVAPPPEGAAEYHARVRDYRCAVKQVVVLNATAAKRVEG